MALNWTAYRVADGQVICHLPQITLQGDLVTQIGQPETSNLILNVDSKTAPEWEYITAAGRGGIFCWTGDPRQPTILGGGSITQRVRTHGPAVMLQIATPEFELDGQPVGTYNNAQNAINQDTILSDLVTQFATGTGKPPWQLTHVNNSTQTQIVTYNSAAKTSVLQAIQNVSLYQNGPEWITGLSWNTATGIVSPTFTYGSRIGTPAPTNLASPATVLTPNDFQTLALTEDYTAGKGATRVVVYAATSTSATTGIPTAASFTVPNLNGRPIRTFEYQPSAQIADPVVLGNMSTQSATAMAGGAIALVGVLSQGLPGKTFGVDWNIGDDLGISIPGGSLVQFPSTLAGTVRVMGVRVNQQTIQPILKGLVTA